MIVAALAASPALVACSGGDDGPTSTATQAPLTATAPPPTATAPPPAVPLTAEPIARPHRPRLAGTYYVQVRASSPGATRYRLAIVKG